MHYNNFNTTIPCQAVNNNLPTYEIAPLSPEDIQKINTHGIKAGIDLDKKRELARIDLERKREMSRIEVEKTDSLMFLRQELENAKFEIIEKDDTLFFIRVYCLDESKNDKFSVLPGIHKICNAQNLKMLSYKCSGDEPEILCIMWNSNSARAILKENTSKGLLKTMEENGITITVPRRKKSDILDVLFQYLYNHAKSYTVPRFYGWNLNADGSWTWASDDEILYERLVKV